MVAADPSAAPARWHVAAALAAVYLIWGSTYLGIRFAIESLPPFLMAGTRFLVAGALLFGWTRFQGVPMPPRAHWRSALIIGGLMLLGGNGGVTWAEQRVPSGLAALMIGATPLWIVVLNWLVFGGARPNRRMASGLAVGLGGLVLLIGPTELAGGSGINPLGATALLAAALAWAAGSLYSRRAALPASPQLANGMEMLCGSALLLGVGTVSGEWGQFNLSHVSLRSALAIVYLTLFGSLIGFSAYIWLLRHLTPARAASYAYVNPVVAVILGWALAGEALSLRTALAAAIIIASVALITSVRAQPDERPRQPAEPRPVQAERPVLEPTTDHQ
jgi:drug/metabolite transporter (DMT)-like permease